MFGRYHQNERHSYPYKIPAPPELDASVLAALKDRRDYVREFLRIEALLRSEKIQALYKQRRRTKGDALQDCYGVKEGWRVLKGAHHRYLDPAYSQSDPKLHDAWIAEGKVFDLLRLFQKDPEAAALAVQSLRGSPHYLVCVFNCSYPPNVLLQAIKPRLAHIHKTVPALDPIPRRVTRVEEHGGVRDDYIIPRRYRKPPHELDLEPWLLYFRAYDLYWRDGMNFGQVATALHLDRARTKAGRAVKTRKQAAKTARRAVEAVRALIKEAEEDQAPPPSPPVVLVNDKIWHRQKQHRRPC